MPNNLCNLSSCHEAEGPDTNHNKELANCLNYTLQLLFLSILALNRLITFDLAARAME